MKVGALPDTAELCHFVLYVVASSECPRTYIFKDWRQYWKLDIDSSDVGGASWWVELVGGWGWP